jgi:hypothetical protein
MIFSRSTCIGVVVVASSSVAYAQEARELGLQGVQLADAGKCAEAIEPLSRSEALFHAPTVLTRLGECQVQLGRLVDGTESLNKVVREALPAGSPPAYVEAQERARKALDEARPKIAKLKIAVAAPPNAQYAVTIDGVPLALANLNVNRPVDPGTHRVEATGPGLLKASAQVVLPAGGADSIALTLQVDPSAPKETQSTQQAANGRSGNLWQPAPAERPNRTPAYIAFAVGGAGLVAGAVFGGLTLSQRSKLDGDCSPQKVCPPASQDTIDTARTFGTISTVGFVVAAAGAATGLVLLLTGSKSESEAKTARVIPGLGTLRVTF